MFPTPLHAEGLVDGDRVGEQTFELVLGGYDAGYIGRAAARIESVVEHQAAAGRGTV